MLFLIGTEPYPLRFSKRTIFGENLVNCRSFSLDSPKVITFAGSYDTLNGMPVRSFPEVAFIGRSNVGKSSLINSLSGQNKKIAVEGKTPGRTQTINVFQCKESTVTFCSLVDLPGYGFAKLSKDKKCQISNMVQDYFLARGSLKLAVLVIDARREAQDADIGMFQVLNTRLCVFIFIFYVEVYLFVYIPNNLLF
jgi:GTP-binding protein